MESPRCVRRSRAAHEAMRERQECGPRGSPLTVSPVPQVWRSLRRAKSARPHSRRVHVNFAASTLGLDSKQVFRDADPFTRFVFRRAFRKSLSIGAAIHECGGARMGGDPAAWVLNEYNQSWDVPNLFVTDASCYVSNGIVGPTLTIMALTARACDYIAREHAAGAFRRTDVGPAHVKKPIYKGER